MVALAGITVCLEGYHLPPDPKQICHPDRSPQGVVGGPGFLSPGVKVELGLGVEGFVDDGFGFGLDLLQVRLIAVAFRVDFVNFFGAGRAGGKPAAFRDYLHSPDRLPRPPGAWVKTWVIFSPANDGAVMLSLFIFASNFFCCVVALASVRS